MGWILQIRPFFFLLCFGSLYVLLPDRAEATDSWNIPYISVSRSVSVSSSVHLCRKKKKGSSWWTSTMTTWPARRPPSCRMLQVNNCWDSDASQHPKNSLRYVPAPHHRCSPHRSLWLHQESRWGRNHRLWWRLRRCHEVSTEDGAKWRCHGMSCRSWGNFCQTPRGPGGCVQGAQPGGWAAEERMDGWGGESGVGK